MSVNKWMSKLTKDFGLCAADIKPPSTEVIKTKSPGLNWVTGCSGFPVGQIYLLYGPEQSGKSLVGQLLEIEIQRKFDEGICILFDTEFRFNSDWFKTLGGDPERLYVRRTNRPEEIFDWIWDEEKGLSKLIADGLPVKSIRIDSIRAIAFPKDLKDSSLSMTMGGSGASYLPSSLKRITPIIKNNNITTIFIQQVYEEMDAYKKLKNAWLVPDGRCLKHTVDVSMEIVKVENKDSITQIGDMQVGHTVRVRCKKNGLGVPSRTCFFKLNYYKGIVDIEEELFNLGVYLGLINHPIDADGKVSTKSWKFGNHDSIIGLDNCKKWVFENKEIQEELLVSCNSISKSILEEINKKEDSFVEVRDA